jgi:hypothetical protein
MNSGAVAALVTIAGLVLSELGVTDIDASSVEQRHQRPHQHRRAWRSHLELERAPQGIVPRPVALPIR